MRFFESGDEAAPFWQIYPTANLILMTSQDNIYKEEFKQRPQSHNLRTLYSFMPQ